MSLLLADNASPGSSDKMMPGFLVEDGGMETLVIVAILLILLTESLLPTSRAMLATARPSCLLLLCDKNWECSEV